MHNLSMYLRMKQDAQWITSVLVEAGAGPGVRAVPQVGGQLPALAALTLPAARHVAAEPRAAQLAVLRALVYVRAAEEQKLDIVIFFWIVYIIAESKTYYLF